MTVLTRRYRFSASHRLCSPSLSEERNREVFGKCSNAFGHGHNYFLEVSVEGDPDPCSGMTLPRADLDAWVEATVLERIDHTHLNTEISEFRDLVPTSENVLVVIASWLREGWKEHFPGTLPLLSGLRLEETPRNSFQIASGEPTCLH